MRNYILLGALIFVGCGGSLSDEQRKKLKEGMEEQKILRVSESEIMAAAMDDGREIYKKIEALNFDSLAVDSLENAMHVSIRWITPHSADKREIENQLIEAYVMAIATGSMQENIQKVRAPETEQYDSLLYTKPKITKLPEGIDQLDGVWNIYLPKKQVILNLGKDK